MLGRAKEGGRVQRGTPSLKKHASHPAIPASLVDAGLGGSPEGRRGISEAHLYQTQGTLRRRPQPALGVRRLLPRTLPGGIPVPAGAVAPRPSSTRNRTPNTPSTPSPTRSPGHSPNTCWPSQLYIAPRHKTWPISHLYSCKKIRSTLVENGPFSGGCE